MSTNNKRPRDEESGSASSIKGENATKRAKTGDGAPAPTTKEKTNKRPRDEEGDHDSVQEESAPKKAKTEDRASVPVSKEMTKTVIAVADQDGGCYWYVLETVPELESLIVSTMVKLEEKHPSKHHLLTHLFTSDFVSNEEWENLESKDKESIWRHFCNPSYPVTKESPFKDPFFIRAVDDRHLNANLAKLGKVRIVTWSTYE